MGPGIFLRNLFGNHVTHVPSVSVSNRLDQILRYHIFFLPGEKTKDYNKWAASSFMGAKEQ